MLTTFKKRLQTLSLFDIFVSISIVVLIVFVVKFFGQKIESKIIRVEVIKKNWTENYDPYGYRAPFWLSDKLKIGQKEYDKSGNVIAEIINIENYERGSEEAEIYLTLKVRTTYQKRLHQHFFKEKPLDLGSAIEISPDQNIVYGQIVDIDVPIDGYPQKTFIITARGRGLDEYIIDKIKVNDKMTDRYNNQPIATLLDFRTEEASRIYVNGITDNNGSLGFKVGSPTKDVVVKIRLTAHEIDKRWYFAGHQNIKVGNALYFYSNDINLYNLDIENVE